MQEVKRVRCLFGTDGVRDVANRGTMTPEMALRLGRAYVLFLTERGIPRPRVVVGRDTRRSGPMLEAALVSGMTSAGAEVLLLHVMPTPGVSYAIKKLHVDGGAVISASHNPAEYNGIKFLDGNGFKLSDEEEALIEEYLGDSILDDWRPTGASIGEIRDADQLRGAYVNWLLSCIGDPQPFSLPLVVDCAHGAASVVANAVFGGWGHPVDFLGVSPNGLNINEGVGVMHMKTLSNYVVEKGFPVGIAYDGDADRVLLTDRQGRVLDGDIMLWVISRWLKTRGKLGTGVVATVMSNLALEEQLGKVGIRVYRCPVGDRYVLEAMRERGSLLGGEQSGHIIIREFVTTGDGLCTGLVFLRACHELGEDLQTLVDRFGRYPQTLRNLPVKEKIAILENKKVSQAVSEAEAILNGQGRAFLRPSGTEPLIRVLVEAKDPSLMESVADFLVEKIKEALSDIQAEKSECL